MRFDARADVAVAPTRDRGLVLAAIDQTVPGAAGTRYGAALAAASDLAAGRPARLVLVTDLQQRGWAERSAAALPAGMDVQVKDVGASAGNVGIAALVRTSDGLGVRLRSDWATRRSTTLTITLDGRDVARQPVSLDPGATSTVPVRLALPPAGVVRARVDDPGGYAADDERFAVLDRAGVPRVVIVTGEGPTAASSVYVEAALAAVDRHEFEVVRWRGPAAGADAPWTRSAAILLLGTYGVDRGSLEGIGRAVAGGAGLLVAAGPAIEPARLDAVLPFSLGAPGTEALPDASMAPSDPRHPAFGALEGQAGWLATSRFRRALSLPGAGNLRVLARFSTGAPALAEQDGRARVLVFASDLSNAWNDLALHPSFVPFVHGLVRYVAGAGARARELQVGDRPDLARPGITEQGGRHVPVNVDPAEADPARLAPAAFLDAVPRLPAESAPPRRAAGAEREREQALWRYGLILMLAALVVESAVGRRV